MEQIVRTPRQIGDAIRRHRRRLGLNQTGLGERESQDVIYERYRTQL